MENFSLVGVVSFPRPWPLAAKSTLLRHSYEGRIVFLIAHTDGHLEAAAGRDGFGIEVRSHFQQISASGPVQGKVIIFLVCHSNEFRLSINDETLQLLSQADGQILAVRQQPELSAAYSFDDPNSMSACERWVDARRLRFAKKQPLSSKKPSRSKSLYEQLDELADAIDALNRLIEDAKRGNKHLTPVLAAQLRSLIYWPNDKPTWNPLLYRLANGKSLPLPVYSFPVNLDEPKVIGRPVYHARNFTPSILRRTFTEVVMDLQEYMTSTVQTVRTNAGESNITIEGTLGATANSLGAAHYDEVILLDIDLSRMQVSMNTNFLHRVIVGLAETVVILGRHVLHAYGHGSS